MYRTIICGIGAGPRETAERILTRAAGLVDKDGSIFVIHVIESVPHRMMAELPKDFETAAIRDAEEKLTALCRHLGISAFIEIRIGSAGNVLLAAAREKSADLIVLSTHVPDITDYVFGAIVDRVVRHAKCSVLIDRKPVHPQKDGQALAEIASHH
jgi:nucleotide-binding universal stress UspA family protein